MSGVDVWVQEDCPKCNHIKGILKGRGVEFRERKINMDDWRPCVEAMSYIQLWGGEFPVVRNGKWMDYQTACKHWEGTPITCTDGSCSVNLV